MRTKITSVNTRWFCAVRGIPGELVLGRYRIENKLGGGGFGRVYLARQTAFNRHVAIKASHEVHRDDPISRERFRREAVLIAQISHPNVVVYHDFGIDEDNDMLLVMEYLKAQSLAELMSKKRQLPLETIVELIEQAAAGLSEAHSRGIIHRDVKPSNLLITKDIDRPILKVIDFGILRMDPRVSNGLERLTKTDVFVGTPAYAAPEMLLDPKSVDARCDQYALALVAYELISGERAFDSNDLTLADRMKDFPKDLTFKASGRVVPSAVGNVLKRALSPFRQDRYPTILQFARAFREAVEPSTKNGYSQETFSTDKATVITPKKATQVDIQSRQAPWTGYWTLTTSVALVAIGFMIAWQFSQKGEMSLRVLPQLTIREDSPIVVGRMEKTMEITPHVTHSRRTSTHTQRTASGMATLTLNAFPWADVSLDGKALGRTPIMDLMVTAEPHTVDFIHPLFGTKKLKVNPKPGEKITLSARFPQGPPSSSE